MLYKRWNLSSTLSTDSLSLNTPRVDTLRTPLGIPLGSSVFRQRAQWKWRTRIGYNIPVYAIWCILAERPLTRLSCTVQRLEELALSKANAFDSTSALTTILTTEMIYSKVLFVFESIYFQTNFDKSTVLVLVNPLKFVLQISGQPVPTVKWLRSEQARCSCISHCCRDPCHFRQANPAVGHPDNPIGQTGRLNCPRTITRPYYNLNKWCMRLTDSILASP